MQRIEIGKSAIVIPTEGLPYIEVPVDGNATLRITISHDEFEYRLIRERSNEVDVVTESFAEIADKAQNHSIAIQWGVEDVRTAVIALQESDRISEETELCFEDETEILNRVKHNHDASVGINWTVLEDEIKRYVKERRL